MAAIAFDLQQEHRCDQAAEHGGEIFEAHAGRGCKKGTSAAAAPAQARGCACL